MEHYGLWKDSKTFLSTYQSNDKDYCISILGQDVVEVEERERYLSAYHVQTSQTVMTKTKFLNI